MKRNDLPKYFEVSAGLVVGAMIVAIIIAIKNGSSVRAALLQPQIVVGCIGLLLTFGIFLWKRS